MKKHSFVIATSWLISSLFMFLLGQWIGAQYQPVKIVEKSHYVLDDLNKCQEHGGEFSIRYSSAYEVYKVECTIPDKSLFKYDLSN